MKRLLVQNAPETQEQREGLESFRRARSESPAGDAVREALGMTKKIYRIEIKSVNVPGKVYTYWIGSDLSLVDAREHAVPVTHDEHILVMEMLQCEATAYGEEAA